MADYFTQIIEFIAAHPHCAVTAVFLLALSAAVALSASLGPAPRSLCNQRSGHRAEVNLWPLLAAALAGRRWRKVVRFVASLHGTLRPYQRLYANIWERL
jgi:hypothetical protein